jgi:hypothetical protein
MHLRSLLVLLTVATSSCLIIQTGPQPSPAKTYCIKNRASGACSCSTSDPGLNGDTDYVDNCDTVPSDAQCCHDINGDGETTFCDCLRPLCATDTDTGNCMCTFFDNLIVGNNRDNEELIQGTCTNTTCCKDSSSCGCYNASNIACSDQKVSSCSLSSLPAKRPCGGGLRAATSCAGLKWKK